jgi:two-component system phosphate regulon sensor histidine kinase PhoR
VHDALSDAAFEALLARTGEGTILVVDHRLRIVRAGAEAARLAERPVEQLRGMSLIAAFGSAALDHVARDALTAAAPATGEADLGAVSGRIFAVDAVPLPTGGLVISLSDVTRLRRIERVRRDFVANISHELRTPLASIKLLAETLSGGAVEDPETAHDFAEQIEREVDHLAQLVDELLDLSMIESGETKLDLQAVAPGTLVAEVAERIRPVAERRRIAVRLLPEPDGGDGVRARADPTRLGQALLNLAHNAVKYSHAQGEVRIGWSTSPGRVRFSVADDGIGIPATHHGRIFERFYKVDRSRARNGDRADGADAPRGGSGLGLAIVRHLAEAHGGTVGLESREGIGSTFWVEVPEAG